MDTAIVKQGTSWLTEAGLRPTRQRLALANFLVGDGRHRRVTAESLYSAVKKSDENVSLATIYNTLKVFSDAGLIREILVDGTKSYFDTRIDDIHTFIGKMKVYSQMLQIMSLRLQDYQTPRREPKFQKLM